ncbi:unnamed protein product [Amoebophrya sp. A25]|nr:unnamed protein product [Amoebophrya sp. A25]|eukprot:GSA25T00007091001.1
MFLGKKDIPHDVVKNEASTTTLRLWMWFVVVGHFLVSNAGCINSSIELRFLILETTPRPLISTFLSQTSTRSIYQA